MCDEQQGSSTLSTRGVEQRHDGCRTLLVEISGRLIGDNKWRVVSQGSGNRHSLLFTSAKLGGPMIATGGEADGIEELKGTLAIGSLRRNHRKEDVLEGGQLRQQIIGLKDETNLSISI